MAGAIAPGAVMCPACWRGAAQALLGNPEQGIADVAEAIRLSPRDGMMVFWTMGLFWA